MKALIVGAAGQLGQSLVAAAPGEVTIVSADRHTLDITDPAAVLSIMEQVRPDLVFNAAAYTAVDRAETEPDAAHAVNAQAVEHLASAARQAGASLVHVSTDFVFDGAVGKPYAPTSATTPLGVYGRTKLAGEVAAGSDALIVRTAWVYAPQGHNFVRTMLRLMRERDEVRVVADQIGTPTYAPDLAAALWALARKGARGIHHYTDAGACSWYDFAVAIQEEALASGLLSQAVDIIPIATTDYPTPAARPHYSVLDKASTFELLGGPSPHWRTNLRKMMAEIKTHG
jgi:dTDP-4-dehydrorhamnose reductase